MILIRGIKGEQYARKIKKGIVDCRDVLSTLLEPPVMGYEFSDYYEKNFVKAVAALYGKEADMRWYTGSKIGKAWDKHDNCKSLNLRERYIYVKYK